ncbi:unnamed protein product [Closterium sp. NIES-64]|nr:unnamed protein product [Closterium sp. NIES-64]CAI5971822.1 unnamed protein product [Closterium sp. NIES-65]
MAALLRAAARCAREGIKRRGAERVPARAGWLVDGWTIEARALLVGRLGGSREVHSGPAVSEAPQRQSPPPLTRLGGCREVHSGQPIIMAKRGADLLHDPWYNKHTAFEAPERDRLGLRGLLPPGYQTMDDQVAQFMAEYRKMEQKPVMPDDPVDLQKWRILNRLHDRNETLYYRVLIDHIQEMSRILYVPTVGTVCQKYSSLFRRPRGMYFSAADRGEMASMVHNWPADKVDVIVMTDGSKVLGLGDLGVQAIAIPVGKLDMYVAAAGIPPNRVLPVMFDVGTNNEALIKNPLYLGLRHPRLDGEHYLSLMDEFMEAVFSRWPNVIVQFEDFEMRWANTLMDRYKSQYRIFNDDIEGTGGVAVAGILNVLRAQHLPPKALADTRVVVAGTGREAEGVLTAVRRAMAVQIGQGKAAMDRAAENFWLVDDQGLMTDARVSCALEFEDFLRRSNEDERLKEGTSLAHVVKRVKPHVLVGLTGSGHLFDDDVLKAMKNADVSRPAVFALSQPVKQAECTAQDAFKLLGPNALFASGCTFPDVRFPNGKVGHTSQANNVFLSPGIVSGSLLSGARMISDGMLQAAAHQLAEYMTDDQVHRGMLYPCMSHIRDITSHVAVAVARRAAEEDLADGISNLRANQLLSMSKVLS